MYPEISTEFDLNAQLQPAQSASSEGGRILVIDDDPDQLEVLCFRLRRQGFVTWAASSGSEGLRQARQQVPHLILLDLGLPDMDGLAVCQQLADQPETCQVPVIVLSGMERPDIVRCTRSAGSQYFVRKPYDPNVLLVLIHNALSPGGDW